MKINKILSFGLAASLFVATLPGMAVDAEPVTYHSIPVDLVAEGIANHGRLVTNLLIHSPNAGIWGADFLSLVKGAGELNEGKDVSWETAWEDTTPITETTNVDRRVNTLKFNGVDYIISVPFKKDSTTDVSLGTAVNVIYSNHTNDSDAPYYNEIDIPDGYYNGISMLGGGYYSNAKGIIFRYVYADGTKSIWQHLWCHDLATNTKSTSSSYTDEGLVDTLRFTRYVKDVGQDTTQYIHVTQMQDTDADPAKKMVSVDFIASKASLYAVDKYDYTNSSGNVPASTTTELNHSFQMIGMTMLQDSVAQGEELEAIYADKPAVFMGTDKDYAWFDSLQTSYNKSYQNPNVNYTDLYTEVKAYIDGFTAPTGTIELFVSPTGDDTSIGTSTAPVASISAAIDKAKEIVENNPSRAVSITLADGEYEMTSTVDITGLTGGVTIKAAEGANPVIKGSKTIQVSDMDDEAVTGRVKAEGIKSLSLENYTLADYICTDVQSTSATNAFGVYVDGEIKPIAEYPNNDELVVDDEFALVSPGADNDITLQANDRFGAYASYQDWYMEGYFKEIYRTYKVHRSNFTIAENRVTFTDLKSTDVKINRNWKIFNVLEELDAVGEWYVDTTAKKLYYMPGTEDSIEISNMADALLRVSQNNVIITGLSFKNTCNNAIEIANDKSDVTITGCNFTAIGRNAILGNRVTNVNICGNTIENIGYKGVNLNGGNLDTLTLSGNVIAQNRISDTGKVVRSYAHAIMIAGVGTEVKNNEISDTKSIALGFEGALHEIHHNKLTNVVTEAKDAGAIYSGRNLKYLGNKIYNNDITLPVREASAETMGIYLDDFLSGTEVHHNIVRNASRGIFSNRGAKNNIYNNVYIGCKYGTSVRKGNIPSSWAELLAKPTAAVFAEKFDYLDIFDGTWSGANIEVYNNYGINVNTMVNSQDYTITGNPKLSLEKEENNVAETVEIEAIVKADIDTNDIGIKKPGLDTTVCYTKINGTTVTVNVISAYVNYDVVAAAYNASGKMIGVAILDGTGGQFIASETPSSVKVIVVENFNTLKPMTK